MQLPNLVIIGVFKAGTTSLFRYLAKHPDVCGSSKKEIHYFSSLVYGTDESLPPIKDYTKFFSCGNEKYRLEASPAYVYGNEKVIKRMKDVLPEDHKVLLIIRDPMDRFISYYKHIRAQFLIDDEFPIFVDKCIEEFQKSRNFRIGHYKNAVREGIYIDYIPVWKEYYQNNLKVIFFDDLKETPKMLLDDIAKWLGIDRNYYIEKDLSVENKTIVPKYSTLHKMALLTYQKIEPALRNSKLKKLIRNFYRKINNSKAEDYNIDKRSKKRLSDIYKPYNLKLKKYLGEIPASWIAKQ